MSDDLVCNVCGKQFKSQKKLSQHSWATHSDENLPCSSCDKTFRTKKHLANHMTDKHTEKEPVQCDFKTNDMACTYYSTSYFHMYFSHVCHPTITNKLSKITMFAFI